MSAVLTWKMKFLSLAQKLLGPENSNEAIPWDLQLNSDGCFPKIRPGLSLIYSVK
jgi:hypothetical protein